VYLIDLVTMLTAWIMVFSFLLFIIGYLSYRRTENKKMLYLAMAFCFFFIKGVLMAVGLFFSDVVPVKPDLVVIGLDVATLLMLYFAVIK